MSLRDALSESRKKGHYLTSLVTRSTSSPIAAAAAASGGGDALGRGANQMTQHAEQLRHFCGYPYAIISTIARRVAGQPIRVARKMTSHEQNEMERAPAAFERKHKLARREFLPGSMKDHHAEAVILPNHPLARAIQNPNKLMVRYALMFVTVACLELTGKCYWWLRRTGHDSAEIWPLPPSWVEPWHQDGVLFHHWEVRPPGTGAPIQLPHRDVAYIYYPDPANPLMAISPLQACAKTVTADEMIEEAQRRAFLNGVNPGLALIAGRLPEVAGVESGQQIVLTKAQRDTLLMAIKQQYRGVQNNEEPLILDGLIKDAKRITTTPREMDFLQSGASTKGRLAQNWSVNPIVMGEIQGVNRAAAAVADDQFVNNCVNPRVEQISEILTAWVGPLWDDDSEDLLVYIEKAHSVDIEYELNVETAMIDRGAMSRNEWRQRHNLPPIEEGDSAFVGGQEVLIRHQEMPGTDEVDGKQTDTKPDYPALSTQKSLAMLRGTPHLNHLMDRFQEDGEKLLEGAARDVFATFGLEFHRRFTDELRRGAAPGASTIEIVVPAQEWVTRLKDACTPHLIQLVVQGAVTEWEVHSSLGKALHLPRLPRDVGAMAQTLVGRLLSLPYWDGVIATVKSQMTTATQKAVGLGLSGADIAERVVRATLGLNASSFRAARVARTESTGALNAGGEMARERLARLGVVRLKKWITRHDEHVRDSHAILDGKTIACEDTFSVGGHMAKYPGAVELPAGERAGCRCLCISVIG